MNSHRRRLSSTAPVPERPPTNSSKPGMQKVFWTSTATRQIRERVLGGRPHAVLLRPRGRLRRALLIGHAPDLADAVAGEVGRDGQLAHGPCSMVGGDAGPHGRGR